MVKVSKNIECNVNDNSFYIYFLFKKNPSHDIEFYKDLNLKTQNLSKQHPFEKGFKCMLKTFCRYLFLKKYFK